MVEIVVKFIVSDRPDLSNEEMGESIVDELSLVLNDGEVELVSVSEIE